MCTYSVISEYGQFRIPTEQWTRPVWSEYQEILSRLAELDKKLDQRDCVDPAKVEWMQAVEGRLKSLEAGKIVDTGGPVVHNVTDTGGSFRSQHDCGPIETCNCD